VNLLDRVVVRGQAYGGWILYLATKYGLYGLNQTLAHELAPEVTVNGIAPGLVIPPDDFSREEVARLLDKIPLKRQVGPEEIAEDVLYLIRSESKTGSVILSDGGSGLRLF
jgi:pteridine reductase